MFIAVLHGEEWDWMQLVLGEAAVAWVVG